MPLIDTTVRFIIEVLFNGLWEAALLALVAWVVLRSMPSGNATTRHSVLVAALLASLLLPIVTATITTMHASAVAPVLTSSHDVALSPMPRHAGSVTYHPAIVAPAPAAVAPSLPRVNLALPRVVAEALVVVWLAGALFVLVRLFLSLLHLERLKSDALPVPVEYRAQLVRWSAATKGSRTVRLCRSSEIVIPIAVGLFDAMILVPDRLLDELGPEDIDRIVLHELAHLRRADDWINAVERVAQALLFFNPGIAWLVAQLDLEREVACDDWVLQQNEALPYATCLARVVESAVWPYRAMSAPGAFVTRRGMSVRIERLLSAHRDVRVRTSFGPTGIAIAVLGALCIVAAFVSPSIAYTTAPAAASAASAARAPAIASTASHAVAATAKTTAKPVSTQSAATVTAPSAAAVRRVVAAASQTAASVSQRAASAAPVKPIVVQGLDTAIERSIVVAANTPDYIDSLASVGYSGLSVDDLVRLRAVGVTADYIRQLANAGLSHPSVRDLVQLRAMDVSPEYIATMRGRFGSSISIEQIASLKAVGVTTAYADEMSALGLRDLDANRVRSLRAVGVTPDYVRELANAGYANLTSSQLLQLRALGIDGGFIARAAAHGFHNLTVEQLVRLKTSEILQ